MSPRGAGFLFGRDVVEVSIALSLRLILIEVQQFNHANDIELVELLKGHTLIFNSSCSTGESSLFGQRPITVTGTWPSSAIRPDC